MLKNIISLQTNNTLEIMNGIMNSCTCISNFNSN